MAVADPSNHWKPSVIGSLMNAADTRYRPEYQPTPGPIFKRPFDPKAVLRWMTFDQWFPWCLIFPVLAAAAWRYLTPPLTAMADFSVAWVALIWLRNFTLLAVVAGTLHWWLYVRRSQGTRFKLHPKWLADNDGRYLWRDQVKDNAFWCLASAVTVWTVYESITWWIYANGYREAPAFFEHPIYFVVTLVAVLFWNAVHFYLTHRLLHWRPLYRRVHERHHRNVNIGPWSGLAMHPAEHAIYFSAIALWWIVPAHPVVVMVTGLYLGLAPAITHAGFDQLILPNGKVIWLGDWFHQLHHRHVNVNFGHASLAPFDKVFDSWRAS